MAIIRILLLSVFCVHVLYAQEPRGISYQGVVLYPSVELPGIDSKVTPYSEKDVCFRFSIYDNTKTFEYSETHRTSTDYYGQVNLIIGRGDNPTTANRLDIIKWNGTAKFLKVELDYSASCADWEEVSYDELNYVPFAFYALNSQASNIFTQGIAPIVVNGSGSNVDPVVIEFDGGLKDLNDVDFSLAPVANQALVFDGINWVAGSVDDADNDPNNEIQTIVSADAGNLVAAGTDGGALLTSIDDADNDPNNEIQTIVSADAGNLVAAGTDGGALLTSIDDADNDPTNEIQTIVSADAGNLVAAGTDGGAYLDQATVQTNESNTSLSQDTTTGVISYVAEDGLTDTANVTSVAAGNILTTGADGGSFLSQATVAANETDTSLAQNTTTGVITYTAEDGNPDTANVTSVAAGNILTTGTDGGAYLDQATVQTNESNTSLSQDTTTGVISYVAEDGLTDTANVTSTDPTNILTTGSDGGAFLNYQGIRSNTTVQEGSGFGVGSPYKIGNPSTGTVDLDINIADIIIFTNPSGGSASIYVELKSLGMDDSYLGKVVKIVQYSGSSPKVTTYDSNDDPQDYSGGGTLADLFYDTNKPYESVSFIWAEKTTSLRQWFPMQ